MDNNSWISPMNAWLQNKADAAFSAWLESKQGRNWRRLRYSNLRRTRMSRSPYDNGFSLPEWHHDCIAAMNRGDEESAKAIKLANM